MDLFSTLCSYLSKNWGNITKVLAVIIGTGALTYAVKIIHRKLIPSLKKSGKIWDDALITSLNKPLKFAIWFNGLTLSGLLAANLSEHIAFFSFLEPFRRTGTVLLLVWFFIRFIRELEIRYIDRSGDPNDRLDKTTLRAISQVLRVAVIGIACLAILQTLGLPLSGILAFGGVGGIAIGFAAKDLLANFFGGLMIFLDRPFAIGDWIRSPDRNIEGTVEHIGWRLTRIRTFDKRPLFVPNSLFLTLSIENPSRMQNRRIKETIGLRYEDADKVAPILKQIEEMLKNHEEIDQTKITFVNLVHFNASSLDFLIYTFTKTTNWVRFQQVQQDVFLKTIEIIEKNGAACAFPTTTLDLPGDFLKEKLDAVQSRFLSKQKFSNPK